ncbi:MAG: TatD family hydrolase [Clostridia bacterium]|nr:TatD family hydrolase [Clostridia bacterium]
MYIDTHCHLDDEKFKNLEEVIENLKKEKISYAINMGCNMQSSVNGKELAEKYNEIYFSCGFHPSDADKFSLSNIDLLTDLSKHPKCVGIGEIGLDYHWEDYPNKEIQINTFLGQLELAKTLKLPVSIHCRDCTEVMLKTLKDNANKLVYGGVMHCFSGSVETAKELLKLGLYISFAGTLTFKNALNLQAVCKEIPLDRILTETDSPYLAPHPFRGTINEPKNIPFIVAKIAELKGLEIEEVANSVMINAKRIFNKI